MHADGQDLAWVRDYTVAQWHSMIAAAGFAVSHTERWPLRMDLPSWVGRMRTPAPAVEALKWVIATAPKEVHDVLSVEPDGSFTPRVGLFLAAAN